MRWATEASIEVNGQTPWFYCMVPLTLAFQTHSGRLRQVEDVLVQSFMQDGLYRSKEMEALTRLGPSGGYALTVCACTPNF
jgi:hypothetical protein